ncbi:LacI family transcriptional regulator [Litorimonas cladophorae]|uniref:LacI family transcriptional regulator n=1 Tax=Litorimonas cladophorae TaxID=1220491 RepID=A0A918KGI6_9PROT|nr:LacI family DNA-binding transcriptional regulator [Litorimonas cladophorae]GGX62661.1 LacI family transcriptional regulator [Litorimonas cladophorae]
MKATITDVAKKAGVSMKTVSRVLNNEPNVAEKTRAHVKAIAAELRYTPNLAARGLATSKSYLIALIYDNPSINYISHIQRGAIDACREAGYHLVVEPLYLEKVKSRAEKADAMRMVLEKLPVDGVILTPPLCDSQGVLQTLSELRIKCVRVAPRNRGQQPFVGMDDDTAAYQMTQYLLEQGHKRIGFIKGHVGHAATDMRYDGYCRAIESGGLSVSEQLVFQGDFSFESGVVQAKKLLELPVSERPTAIFASNDDMAAAVISVASQMGLDVPADLSVCGFDDTPLARNLSPALTTVRQPIYKMGFKAAQQLIDPDGDQQKIGQILDFEIMLRDTVSNLKN